MPIAAALQQKMECASCSFLYRSSVCHHLPALAVTISGYPLCGIVFLTCQAENNSRRAKNYNHINYNLKGKTMKKVFIAALMVVALGGSAIAAVTPAPLPVTTKMLNHFNTAFAGADNVQWKTGSTFVKATFTRDTQRWEAFYDLDGELFGTSRNVELSSLPAKSVVAINKKYADYTVKEVIEFNNDKEGNTYFYVALVKDCVKLIMQVETNGELSVFKKSKV